jgi:predicted Zn-dependent protease
MRRRSSLAAAVSLVAVVVLACTAARLATPGGEAKLGAEAAAEIESKVGTVRAPALEAYVGAVGQRLVEHGSRLRRDVPYRVQIVDMVPPNAFALPGGYIYVSRGLLALLNSEDELASVIAHEIGHVSARHHLNHSLQETPFLPVRLAAGIGSIATGIVSPQLGRVVGAVGSAPGSLYLASHSRGQEQEADEIGQRLVADAGWDPAAMARLMDALSRDTELAGHDPSEHGFLDTHPTTPKRSRESLARAATLEVAAIAPIAPDTAHFYQKLDGLLFGDPASQGTVVENEFLHAELDLRVAFPKDWRVANGAEAVAAVPEARDALAALSIAATGDDPKPVASRVVQNASLQLDGSIETTRIGGLAAARATGTTRESLSKRYHHVIAWVAHGGNVYQLSGSTLEQEWARYRGPLTQIVESIRALSDADRRRVREARIRVVAARPGERPPDLLARADSAWSPERAASANAITAADAVLPGGRSVKVARWEAYTPAARER